jgi:two-component system, chemotaxis family, chemotaxis protein CheY
MSAELQSAKAEPEPGTDTRRAMRLLIVDDDIVQQELLKRAAGRSGFEIVVAGSCTEAIRHLETDGFECVMLDLELADGDGIEVCKAMVRTKYSGALIIISGTDSRRRSSARAYARSLGIVAQGLPKPVDLSSLRVCLANLGKDIQGLPAIHDWGGVFVGRTKEAHRAEAIPAARSRRRQQAASRP